MWQTAFQNCCAGGSPLRRFIFFLAVFVAGTAGGNGLTAVGQEPDATPPPKRVGDVLVPGVVVRTGPERSSYPQNLLHTIETIEGNYISRVSRVDLLVAALSGLYESSGESPPESLRAEVDQAVRAKDVQRLIDSTRKGPNLPADQPDETAILRLIRRTRNLLALAKRVNDDEALLASARAMVRLLDPYCEVLIGDEARRSTGSMDNFGVGIDLDENDGTGAVRIREVLPGSPAQKAGLRPGDRIAAVD